MSDLIFYTNPMSRGQVVRWALHEADADYDERLVEYGAAMKSADYLAINPMGKVPAIEHDGQVVTEAAAICAYLAEAFPTADLAPETQEYADYYRWLFFAAGPVEQAVTSRSMGFDPDEDQQRLVGFGSYERVIATLSDKFAASDFVCGDRFTMADVYVGAQVDWGLGFGTMAETPSLIAYAERVRERPAYRAAKAIDESLIAKRQPTTA